jgi:hypothetical protein
VYHGPVSLYRCLSNCWRETLYVLAQTVPLHRLAQIMGHDSLDTTAMYVRGTPQDLQQAVEQRAWT